ncbi:MAG: DUF2442 domain-containing protein [Lachnospiraceae bacterium]|jgi:hypothetical protein|nr:DUF2442 domain-containing protein [Lachnospiraceae bacterium]
MYIIDGIAYAGDYNKEIKVMSVKPLNNMMMLITFSTGEVRLFDATYLLEMPAFGSLEDPAIFSHPSIEYGVVTWNNGDIDIAPETMYCESYPYQEDSVYVGIG